MSSTDDWWRKPEQVSLITSVKKWADEDIPQSGHYHEKLHSRIMDKIAQLDAQDTNGKAVIWDLNNVVWPWANTK
jgi:hypothetical protein